MIQKILSTY